MKSTNPDIFYLSSFIFHLSFGRNGDLERVRWRGVAPATHVDVIILRRAHRAGEIWRAGMIALVHIAVNAEHDEQYVSVLCRRFRRHRLSGLDANHPAIHAVQR